jgi:hypothetical protein
VEQTYDELRPCPLLFKTLYDSIAKIAKGAGDRFTVSHVLDE